MWSGSPMSNSAPFGSAACIPPIEWYRERFAGIVLSYVGTPFSKHGREPRKGLDCAGVVICGIREAGLDCTDYPYILNSQPDLFDLILKWAQENLEEGDRPLQRGDVLAMRWSHMPNHMAVYVGNNTIVHAIPGKERGVKATLMDYSVEDRIKSIWRLRFGDSRTLARCQYAGEISNFSPENFHLPKIDKEIGRP